MTFLARIGIRPSVRVAAWVLALALPVAASSVLSVDFGFLSQRAQHVVGGEIRSIVSEKDPANGYIYSTVTVAVSEAVPAEHAGQAYSFRMIGGEVAGNSIYISDFPKLETGQSVVLFLQGETSSVFGPTVGLWQGVFFVEGGGADGAGVVTDHQRRPILGVRERQLIRGFSRGSRSASAGLTPDGAPEGIGLKEFFEQVRIHRSLAAGQ